MDETGMLNPIFRKVTNIKKQSGTNQMGIKQINQNMENQFDSNMMIQNSFSINNPMKNQEWIKEIRWRIKWRSRI
jgi:hypothetical protein